MAQASVGDKVRVHYRLLLGDKLDFCSTYGGAPLEFTLGRGMMFRGFEHAVIGMNQGELKEISVAPEDACGKIVSPDGIHPLVGNILDFKIELVEIM
jgi:FKBP-type peptidyl-prolyl cis-trans isomerase 2